MLIKYSRTPESWKMASGGFVLGSLVLYLKGMRTTMFQLSGFYCTWTLTPRVQVPNYHTLSKIVTYITTILNPNT